MLDIKFAVMSQKNSRRTWKCCLKLPVSWRINSFKKSIFINSSASSLVVYGSFHGIAAAPESKGGWLKDWMGDVLCSGNFKMIQNCPFLWNLLSAKKQKSSTSLADDMLLTNLTQLSRIPFKNPQVLFISAASVRVDRSTRLLLWPKFRVNEWKAIEDLGL